MQYIPVQYIPLFQPLLTMIYHGRAKTTVVANMHNIYLRSDCTVLALLTVSLNLRHYLHCTVGFSRSIIDDYIAVIKYIS